MRLPPVLEFFFGAFAALLLVVAVGCNEAKKQEAQAAATDAPAALPSPEELKKRIDAIVDFSAHSRYLNSKDQSAWQVVHGALMYGEQFQIMHDGKLVPALDYLLSGGKLNGWNLRKGDHGVIAVLEQGSKTGQGHPDQWLGYLSQCGLSKDHPLTVGGEEFTVNDLITQAQWDIHDGMEATWTLMAFSTYLPMDAKWTAKDGSEWTIDRIVDMESKAEAGACGNTHRLYGMVVALNRHMKEGGKLEGPWKKVHEMIYGDHSDPKNEIKGIIDLAQEFQQPDGTLSASFFARAGSTKELTDRIHATGHQLEVLATAADEEQIQEEWMTRAALSLTEMLERTQDFPLECGALYHAVRGLDVYRAKRFGPRDVEASPDAPEAAAAE